uniref:Uncharacterized protein n=1 Tax=Nelumbo nucifera TaxID=4432 RepID=A0A822ZTC6_NELNU|nr:TPA_asm: hypothetical protein HUJ06_018064 [Nelumbo nucifera]
MNKQISTQAQLSLGGVGLFCGQIQ